MNDSLKETLRKRGVELFSRDDSGKGYVCPICGSGRGPKGTGMTTKDGIHFTCWAGCFTNADIFEIIGKAKGIEDFGAQVQEVADMLGVPLDQSKKWTKVDNRPEPKKEQHKEQNFTDFFLQANKRLKDTNYHRGISVETLNRFMVGYDPKWRHPDSPTAPAMPRLIIPTSSSSYLARATDQSKPEKLKAGQTHLFNEKALYTSNKPVFVVEGEIDALSIIDVGGAAVGLGSTANVKLLLGALEKQKPNSSIIVCMDNDDAGEKAADKLTEGLERLRIPFYRWSINPYKDANDALQANRGAFMAMIKEAEQIESRELEKESAAAFMPEFFREVEARKNAKCYITGFPSLDKVLGGGLYAGLYIVGAVTSLGKTTFCLQVADNIAQQGHDVLFISLEMARSELIAKSLSRLTFTLSEKDMNVSKTTRGILNGDYNPAEKQIIKQAADYYSTIAKQLYILEGIGNIGVEQIKEEVKRHKRMKGEAPVLIIDYLQILAPEYIGASDKQNTDKAVMELKRLSRDYNIPVIGISSFNRMNYDEPVNMGSYKESGAIEYSSDCLIGLQYNGMEREKESDAQRKERINTLKLRNQEAANSGQAQSIQIKILKNRNGSKGNICLDYYPMFNRFAEPEQQQTVQLKSKYKTR